jgi:hypothetical protein
MLTGLARLAIPTIDNTRALIIQDNKVNQNQKGKRPKADWRKLQ